MTRVLTVQGQLVTVAPEPISLEGIFNKDLTNCQAEWQHSVDVKRILSPLVQNLEARKCSFLQRNPTSLRSPTSSRPGSTSVRRWSGSIGALAFIFVFLGKITDVDRPPDCALKLLYRIGVRLIKPIERRVADHRIKVIKV